MEIEEIALRLAAVFSGRDDAHGYYGAPTQKEESGKRVAPPTERRTVREPVTLEKWVAHLKGEIGLGIVPIRIDSTCSWGAIDIDKYDGLNHGALVARLMEAELPLIVCTSKSGGAHVFAFVGERVTATEMRDKLREIVKYLGLAPNTEIFPKQTTQIVERGDIGNFLNMPYQNLRETTRYAIRPDGRPASVEEFLHAAELVRSKHKDLSDFVVRVVEDESSFSEAPPCLEYLTRHGFASGSRNNGLFSLGVYCRKAFPGKWKQQLAAYNAEFFKPPLDATEVAAVISSLARKDYAYRCHEEPIRSYCDKATCRTREYGVSAAYPVISHLAKIESDPPIWLMDVDGQRIEFDCTRDWMDQHRFAIVVTERIHRMPARMKDPEWRAMWNDLLASVETLPAPPEASLAGEFYELLNSFAERMAQTREQLLLGLPWAEEGSVWFSLADLQNHLRHHDFKEYERRHILIRLRAIGAMEKQLKIKGKVLRVWGVPEEWFNRQQESFDHPDVSEREVL